MSINVFRRTSGGIVIMNFGLFAGGSSSTDVLDVVLGVGLAG
jgi:hypothetical protein